MTHHRYALFFMTLLLAGVVYAYVNALVPAPTPVAAEAPDTANVQLREENGSGVVGTALLTGLPDGLTRVEVSLSGAPENVFQPMNIYLGTCASLGPVKYTLTSGLNGSSETVIGVPLALLRAGPALVLNVHKSAEEPRKYVACGPIVL